MLTNSQAKAAKMLFVCTEEEVARKLRVKEETLEGWKADAEFTDALFGREKENRAAARRMLSKICVDACRELDALINSDDEKNKPKAIIEVLKASGLFKELDDEDDDFVDSLVARLAEENEEQEDEC